jgi:hypothetical protein
MKKPYLIQRAKFIKEDEYSANRKGIDKLLGFDYMGSAEFEFGALPKSLKRIRADIKDYVQFQYSFKKHPAKVVTVMCKKDEQDEVCEILEQLVLNEIRLKERCDLSKFISGKTDSWDNDFWWDIDNDFMFWKFTPDFDIKFKRELSEPVNY